MNRKRVYSVPVRISIPAVNFDDAIKRANEAIADGLIEPGFIEDGAVEEGDILELESMEE